jgi:hypothetical protein
MQETSILDRSEFKKRFKVFEVPMKGRGSFFDALALGLLGSYEDLEKVDSKSKEIVKNTFASMCIGKKDSELVCKTKHLGELLPETIEEACNICNADISIWSEPRTGEKTMQVKSFKQSKTVNAKKLINLLVDDSKSQYYTLFTRNNAEDCAVSMKALCEAYGKALEKGFKGDMILNMRIRDMHDLVSPTHKN